MFSSLFFLILTVLLINLAPEIRFKTFVHDPVWGWIYSLMAYLFTLGVIYLQNLWLARRRNRSRWLVLANLEMVVFLIVYFFILGGDRIYGSWQSINAIIALVLYFGGLALFHYTFTLGSHRVKRAEMARQMKLTMPFALPFIVIVILLDALFWVPEAWSDTVLTGVSFLGVLALAMLAPITICQAWGCIKMRDEETRERLEGICQRAGFKHAGILEWTIMNHTPTAAIIGIFPNFRYILFSRYLLHTIPPEAIDAILAHEIGHSQRKHMLIYPLIIMGMVTTAGLAGMGLTWLLEGWDHPYYKPVALFFCYAVVLGVYFRLVFGYFSRIFERQADLHVLELGIPLQDMITALDEVGIHTGHTHLVPSWHHYSIAERIAFLQKCMEDPTAVERHHRLVRISLLIYFLLLGLAISFLVF